jgi:hypothetical protein
MIENQPLRTNQNDSTAGTGPSREADDVLDATRREAYGRQDSAASTLAAGRGQELLRLLSNLTIEPGSYGAGGRSPLPSGRSTDLAIGTALSLCPALELQRVQPADQRAQDVRLKGASGEQAVAPHHGAAAAKQRRLDAEDDARLDASKNIGNVKNIRDRKYVERILQTKSMDEIDKKHPFDIASLASRPNLCDYDKAFLHGKAEFQRLQSEGKVPSDRQLFEQARAAAPEGQRYFEASIPYWVGKGGSEAVGENIMWNKHGDVVARSYWRRGAGDQVSKGKTVTLYHNIEGVTAPLFGSHCKGWVKQSTKESDTTSGAHTRIDMHGRVMASGVTRGCEAHPSDDKNFQNWANFRDKIHFAIIDNASRGLRPFASLHVGFDYALRSNLSEAAAKYKRGR